MNDKSLIDSRRPVAARVAGMLLAAAALLAGPAAQARNVGVLRPVEPLMAEPANPAKDLFVRFGAASAQGTDVLASAVRVRGAADYHADIVHGKGQSNDERVCDAAFRDALAKLADAARRAGAAAIVGIVSDNETGVVDDPANFECRAGSVHAFVTLRASLARTVALSRPLPPDSGFARLDDVQALPASDAAKARYAHFLTLPSPRAFVLYEDGGWRFYAHDPEAMTKALDYCARQGRRCWLYAADDRVVWRVDVGQRIGLSSALAPAAASSGVAVAH